MFVKTHTQKLAPYTLTNGTSIPSKFHSSRNLKRRGKTEKGRKKEELLAFLEREREREIEKREEGILIRFFEFQKVSSFRFFHFT